MFRDRLPSESEINIFDSLDERHAVELFLGKDLQEAEALFRDNFPYYQEWHMWMGPKAFCFYADAVIKYLLDPAGEAEADDVRMFVRNIAFQKEQFGDQFASFLPRLKQSLNQILARTELWQDEAAEQGRILRQLEEL